MPQGSQSLYVRIISIFARIALVGLFCLGLAIIGFGIYSAASGRMVGLVVSAIGIPFTAIGGYFLWANYLADIDWSEHSTDNTITGLDGPDDDF
ncbi:hypothetical protein [Halobaculum roseum]|uniref:Uncharacterized protein n=1 Tax=Halobaculum roseum TaxID=2175149 RepID=A0ABD5MPA7_9EURY|nr:hypothetical protein [Halobaculum roseum]QZY04315.1 hypothetical protein K6T36_15390 [Halobaculum roseum]